MTLEVRIWKLGKNSAAPIEFSIIDSEKRLESCIASDPSLLREDLWLIGRQVQTGHGTLDLLALNGEADVVVIELKRDKTPRDVVAQTLDYAAWARGLKLDDIKAIWSKYRSEYDQSAPEALEAAFEARFKQPLPEEVNSRHELLVVSAALDPASERIIEYLGETYKVPINAAFFKFFRDGANEYLTRAWLRDPAEIEEAQDSKSAQPEWNKRDFYVALGGRDWEELRKYGFVSAGGGPWYTNSLKQLGPKHRVFAFLPQRGYVGVGEVESEVARAADLGVEVDGQKRRLGDVAKISAHRDATDDTVEMGVRVRWIKTVPAEKALREPGLFANQNSACKLRHARTLERLYAFFGIEPEATT